MPTDWFLEEYKIVQIKIDEVLKSQFQVRSWCVTLLAAAVFGILGTGRSPLWLAFALPIVGMFQLVDWRQKWFRQTLARRAMNLESGINLLGLLIKGFDPDERKLWARLRKQVPDLRGVPGVARVLAQENTKLDWVRSHAETFFYCIQYALILVIMSEHALRHSFEAYRTFRALLRLVIEAGHRIWQ